MAKNSLGIIFPLLIIGLFAGSSVLGTFIVITNIQQSQSQLTVTDLTDQANDISFWHKSDMLFPYEQFKKTTFEQESVFYIRDTITTPSRQFEQINHLDREIDYQINYGKISFKIYKMSGQSGGNINIRFIDINNKDFRISFSDGKLVVAGNDLSKTELLGNTLKNKWYYVTLQFNTEEDTLSVNVKGFYKSGNISLELDAIDSIQVDTPKYLGNNEEYYLKFLEVLKYT